MITIERIGVMNFENAIHGARSPMSSWNRAGSFYNEQGNLIMGPNDLNLTQRLARTDSDHRKFTRQIFVFVDFTTPLCWWEEYDTYKVATVTNSTFTVHRIASGPFTLDDFSHERISTQVQEVLAHTVFILEDLRKDYLKTKDKET